MSGKKAMSLLTGVSIEDVISKENEEAGSAGSGALRTTEVKTVIGKSALKSTARSAGNPSGFAIIENYGKLSERKSAATFALVDWHGNRRYDLRSWSEDYSTPYKGITFTEKEIMRLFNALDEYEFCSNYEVKYLYSSGKAKAKILDSVCMLSTSTERGLAWVKQVNIIDWGFGPKYDFRKWTANFEKCSKGICLTEAEVEKLLVILNAISG